MFVLRTQPYLCKIYVTFHVLQQEYTATYIKSYVNVFLYFGISDSAVQHDTQSTSTWQYSTIWPQLTSLSRSHLNVPQAAKLGTILGPHIFILFHLLPFLPHCIHFSIYVHLVTCSIKNQYSTFHFA